MMDFREFAREHLPDTYQVNWEDDLGNSDGWVLMHVSVYYGGCTCRTFLVLDMGENGWQIFRGDAPSELDKMVRWISAPDPKID